MKIGDIYKGKATKYNCYIEGDKQEEHSCNTCVRKYFSYPYTCKNGWIFIREGEAQEKGETCINWTECMDCKVD